MTSESGSPVIKPIKAAPRKSPTLEGYWEVWEVKISPLFFSGKPRQPPL